MSIRYFILNILILSHAFSGHNFVFFSSINLSFHRFVTAHIIRLIEFCSYRNSVSHFNVKSSLPIRTWTLDDDLVVPDFHGAGHQGESSPAARRWASVQCHHQGPARDTRLHHGIRYGREYITFDVGGDFVYDESMFGLVSDQWPALLPADLADCQHAGGLLKCNWIIYTNTFVLLAWSTFSNPLTLWHV